VTDFLVDDERWTIRYLVVDSSRHLDWRQVLISPISFLQAEGPARRFDLALTIDKIRNSPRSDSDKPVSRQHERDYFQYYGYPYYWGYSGLWGAGSYPGLLAVDTWKPAAPDSGEKAPGDSHLRSSREVTGYHIQATDGAIGHIADFIVDDETWEVRYLVVDTSNWNFLGFGKDVLVAPHWASRVSWAEKKVHLDMSREAIKGSPSWDGNTAVNREYETRLYDYFGRPVYWTSDLPRSMRPNPPPAGSAEVKAPPPSAARPT
jgi:hypothetical protein